MRGKTEKNRTVFDYTGNASIHIFRGFNHGGQYPVLWVAAGCPAMAVVDGQYTCVGTFGRVCLSDKQGVCLSKQKFCRETGFAGINFLCGCAIVFPRGGYRGHVAAGRRSHLERLASKDPYERYRRCNQLRVQQAVYL